MKFKILLIIVAIALIFLSCGKDETEAEDSPIRFDGLYRAQAHDNYWYYLKFYSDGIVVRDLSSLDPSTVFDLLDKDTNDGKGEYSISDDHIEFTTVDPEITIDYEGTIEDGGLRLVLDWYSHANGNSGTRTYEFVKP
jgi:hypothetical protein